ncbi:MAG TPA: hypothetical protein VLK84_17550 [Longimicrobium sp.]|nr:hypothetical protein [Longimicrobium sp.]
MQIRSLRRIHALAAAAVLSLAAACDGDPTEAEIAERLVVTVNSVDNTLSLVPVDGSGTQSREVSLGAQGTPVDLAIRGATAVVPMGTYPFASVVDLREGRLAFTVPLPAGSGATGVAFVNDTLALVANPALNTVSPIRVRSGTAGAPISVGTYPHAIVEHRGRMFVLNANLVNFAPAGPGSVTVLDAQLGVVKTIQLSGRNPQAGAVAGNRLYVINAGTFSAATGSLSVIDLNTLAEVEHYTGFGAFPTAIAASEGGDLHIGGYGLGVFVWDPQDEAFIVPPANPVEPNNSAIVADIGFDYQGRLHVTDSDACTDPGFLYRLDGDYDLERTVTVGVCPVGLEFANIPEEDN